MPVLYDGKKLTPAPFVSISRENITAEDGSILGHFFQITLKGKIMAYKGSPNSTGVFWTMSGYPPDEVIASNSRFGSLLRKQEAIRNLFSVDGKTLELTPWDGSTPVLCQPRVKRVDTPEGLWVEECEYTVTLEADSLSGLTTDIPTAGQRVLKVGEEWNLEILDEHHQTYRLTHHRSATGRRVFDNTGNLLDGKEAWQNAQDWVMSGLGIDSTKLVASGLLNLTNHRAYNFVRANSINESAGIYSVQESWVGYNPSGEPPAINDYTVESRYSIQDNRTTVSIQGTVTGFEERDNASWAFQKSRYENATAKWNTKVLPFLLSTAQDFSQVTLNPLTVSSQLGTNPAAGTITYNYAFDNRPQPTTSGALTEVVTVQDEGPSDVFAQIPVLGRPFGPVLQDIQTKTARKRSISIEIQMPPSTMTTTAAQPNVNGIIAQLTPTSLLGVFVESTAGSWTPNSGRFSRNVSFVWE